MEELLALAPVGPSWRLSRDGRESLERKLATKDADPRQLTEWRRFLDAAEEGHLSGHPLASDDALRNAVNAWCATCECRVLAAPPDTWFTAPVAEGRWTEERASQQRARFTQLVENAMTDRSAVPGVPVKPEDVKTANLLLTRRGEDRRRVLRGRMPSREAVFLADAVLFGGVGPFSVITDDETSRMCL